MTEQDLDDPDVGAALQKMGGKAMPKRVGRHRLADPGAPPCGATRRLEGADSSHDRRAPGPETATELGRARFQ